MCKCVSMVEFIGLHVEGQNSYCILVCMSVFALYRRLSPCLSLTD